MKTKKLILSLITLFIFFIPLHAEDLADEVNNPNTRMTINLATGLSTEREICDIASYVVSIKK